MKRVIVITHGRLSDGFVSALKVISAENPDVQTVSLNPSTTMEEMQTELRTLFSSYEEQDLKIALTDIPFGSTTQSVLPFISEIPNLYVISGVNLALIMAIVMESFENNPAEKLNELVLQARSTVKLLNGELNLDDDD